MDPYLIARWLHILSSTVLFGTGIGTAFQMVMAMRRGTPEVVHATASAVVVADWLFTTPAGLVQPLTGIWMAHLAGYPLLTPWLVATYGLYVLAFLAWAPVVVLQMRIRDLAATALRTGQPLPARARQLYRIWFALGWPGFGALVAVFWLMVSRPDPMF